MRWKERRPKVSGACERASIGHRFHMYLDRRRLVAPDSFRLKKIFLEASHDLEQKRNPFSANFRGNTTSWN
jgi:hypothetical protein